MFNVIRGWSIYICMMGSHDAISVRGGKTLLLFFNETYMMEAQRLEQGQKLMNANRIGLLRCHIKARSHTFTYDG